MREALLEVLDHGFWTFGVVSLAALVAFTALNGGVLNGFYAFLMLVSMVFVLGVTGWHAVEAIDQRVGGDRDA